MPMAIAPKQYVPVHEIASRLCVSEQTVRRMIKSEQIPALNIGTEANPEYRLCPVEVDSALAIARNGDSK